MTFKFFIFFVFLISGVYLSEQTGDWGYSDKNGPSEWPKVCQTGKNQSPIDIETDHTVKNDLGSLKFTRYDFAYTGIMTNTGHNVQIKLKGVPVYLTGGGLTSTFVLEQMHFHWGAEHTIDGVRDALELHLVHYDKLYDNFTNAAQHRHGLAVIAVLFKLVDEDNLDLIAIQHAVSAVSEWVGQSNVEIQRKVVPMWLLPRDKTSFYRYEGSLTTPGCLESVMWFIFTERLTISETQLKTFTSVQNQDGILKRNYRPTQHLGGRVVYHHLQDYSSSHKFTLNSSLISALIMFLTINSLY